MWSYSRILLPLDGSDAAAVVMPQLLSLLKKGGSDVVVLRVVDDPAVNQALPGDAPPSSRVALDQAQAYVEEVVRELRDAGLEARGRVMAGYAVGSIVDVAKQEEANLLVMATHGRTGLKRWALGSVAESVLRASEIPLLVVRAFAGRGEEAGLERSERRFERVLVPIDGTDRSLEVVPHALSLARVAGARLIVTHFASDYLGKKAMAAGQTALDRAQAAFASSGVEVEYDLRRGDPATGIVDYGLLEANPGHRVDAVVMCSRGRSPLARLVLGSVASRVLRAAVVPVLVVPA